MKTKLEKKEFISELKNVLKVRAQLLTMREILLGVARKFDGKVYNKRFDNAALEALKKLNDLVRIETEFRNPSKYNEHELPVVEVGINVRTDERNYSKYESLYLHLVLVDNRINMAVTETDTMSERWIENFNKETVEIEQIIKDYDKLMKIADKLEEAAKAYNNINYRFRHNLRGLNIVTF